MATASDPGVALDISTQNADGEYLAEDVVGGSFATLESDPGVFTSLMQKLGCVGVEAKEILSLESLEPSLSPYGFVLCCKWAQDSYGLDDYGNDELDQSLKPWFANQLSDDSCATLALLNILFNCENVNLGERLTRFRRETLEMDAAMRGLCIASSNEIREIHNSFARPADIRGSLSKIADITMNPPKISKPQPPQKTSKTLKAPEASKGAGASASESPEQYHFFSYVLVSNHVWEMDGLKSAPLECAALDDGEHWLEVVRPAIQGRISALATQGDIRFNLLALVPCGYHARVGDYELARREITFIERRLKELYGDTWLSEFSEDLHKLRTDAMARDGMAVSQLPTGFGARSNEIAMKVLRMRPEELSSAWERVVRRLVDLQLRVDDELKRAMEVEVEHIKRTHDYEPFIRAYVTRLYNAGYLQGLLDIDANGRFRQPSKKKR